MLQDRTSDPKPAYVKGALCGLAAMSIWAGASAITRLAVTTRLDAWDLSALRFGVAGVLLFPVVARRGLARDRLGWLGLLAMVAGAGVPFALATAEGLRFAPARDQGTLSPGFMPLFVAAIAAIVLRESLSRARVLGLSLIFAGALVLVGSQAAAWGLARLVGQALFLLASFLWASFTVIMRQARLDPLHAAALVSVGSLVLYLPPYLLLHGSGMARVPVADIALQAIYQGVLVIIISLILYGRAIAILGTSGGAAFGALVPALSALFAIPLLGEWPGGADWLGIGLVSLGAYLASGGPIPSAVAHGRRRGQPSPRRPLSLSRTPR
jgi:drug/metabolite transporter (DMT)-like permease